MFTITIKQAVRGFFVAICATIITIFMILILGPVVPFITFNTVTEILLICLVFFLSIVTYFILPKDNIDQTDGQNLPDLEENR